MSIPTEKSSEIERLVDSIRADICTWCGKPATQFKDNLSRKEYTISGLCQQCQDGTFGDSEEGYGLYE